MTARPHSRRKADLVLWVAAVGLAAAATLIAWAAGARLGAALTLGVVVIIAGVMGVLVREVLTRPRTDKPAETPTGPPPTARVPSRSRATPRKR